MENKFKAGMIAWSSFDGFQILKDNISYPTYKLIHGVETYTLDGFILVSNAAPSLLTVEEAEKLGYKMTRADKKRLGVLKSRFVAIEKWVNAYSDGKKSCVYDTEEEARSGASLGHNYLFPVKLIGTYEAEVEE